jgi:hypothetical protein
VTDVSIDLHGRRGQVVIDGRDISNAVGGVSIDATPRDLPEITVRLLGVRTIRVDGDARVTVDDDTRIALMAIGWTPPQEAP